MNQGGLPDCIYLTEVRPSRLAEVYSLIWELSLASFFFPLSSSQLCWEGECNRLWGVNVSSQFVNFAYIGFYTYKL